MARRGVIEAVFTRRDGEIAGFAIRGHAEVAPRGEDIVCAAVSALAQGILIGLEEVVGIAPEVDVRDGWLSCRLPEDLTPQQRREAQVLAQTLLLALRAIEEGYGDAVAVREVIRGGAGGQRG